MQYLSSKDVTLSSAELSRFCRDRFLPFWVERSSDSTFGGFHERLDRASNPIEVGYKRMRVHGRQLFFLSGAKLLDLLPDGDERALQAMKFVRRAFWDDRSGGWFSRVTPDGGHVVDGTKYLYCQSFALFGLGYTMLATGDKNIAADIERTLDFLDMRMREPKYGGYVNCIPAEGSTGALLPREQNPHMHLLEAYIVLYRATHDEDYLERARSIVDLWLDKFIWGDDAQLLEHFKEDWTAADGEKGRRVEPGHQLEWYWLLHSYYRVSGDRRVTAPAQAMLKRSLAIGLEIQKDALAAVFDQVDLQGNIVLSSKRLWPQTEMVKAMLAAYEWTGETTYLVRADKHLRMIFAKYFDESGATFTEQFDRSGKARLVDFMPVSSIYHLFLAFAEWIRVLQGVESAGGRHVSS